MGLGSPCIKVKNNISIEEQYLNLKRQSLQVDVRFINMRLCFGVRQDFLK